MWEFRHIYNFLALWVTEISRLDFVVKRAEVRLLSETKSNKHFGAFS